MIKNIFYTDDEEFRPQIAYAIIAVALVSVGWFAYSAWTHGGGQIEANLMCATAGCTYADARQLKVGDSIPALCPKCGKQSVYQALKCPKCGKPHLMNEVRGLPGPTRCSTCGTEIPHAGS